MADAPHPRHGGTDGPDAASVRAVARVAGASISTMGGILSTETLSATDAVIARVDELQFDLREGPCWDALATGRPVFEPDLAGAPQHSWPVFADELRNRGVAALFAFPMIVGPFAIGAIDLYDVAPRELDDESVAQTMELAAATGRQVLRQAIHRAQPGSTEPFGPHARRIVHQATGFVIAQLGVPVDEAELLIRASAFAEGRPVRAVAEEIVRRERSFTLDGGTIEERR